MVYIGIFILAIIGLAFISSSSFITKFFCFIFAVFGYFYMGIIGILLGLFVGASFGIAFESKLNG